MMFNKLKYQSKILNDEILDDEIFARWNRELKIDTKEMQDIEQWMEETLK